MTSTADPLDTLRSALADRYTIERELGAGGMATVYLAEDLKHHRHVAIKVLRAELSVVLGPERFLKEIELTANLQHPHILPLFDSGSAEGLLYYVMPYVEGETLRHRLDRERQLPVADAIRIACEVANALEYAHHRGVVHRDVKPENILLDNDQALVTDFGIALAVEQAGGQRMTQTGLSLGTPQYMAPEQAMGEREISARADIYALGAVMYEMLAGEPPFTGPNSQAIVARVLTEEPHSLVSQRRSVSAQVEAAVFTALEKLPADRFASAAEFARSLGQGEPTGRTGVRRRPPHPHVTLRTVVLASLAAAIATGAVAFFVGRSSAARDLFAISLGRATKVTWDPGLEVAPALSPDGRSVAYAAGNITRMRIFVRQVSGGRALALTDDSMDVQADPQWSPDGTRILFLSSGGVFSAPASGGSARAELPASPHAITSAAWGPDGHTIAYTIGDSVFARSAAGRSRPLARVREAALCRWAPGGAFIACASGNAYYSRVGRRFGNISPSRVLLIRVRDGIVIPVTDSTSANQSPAWSGDGHWLYYLSNRLGLRDIYALRISDDGHPHDAPVRLTTGLDAHSISTSGDGTRIAYDRYVETSNVWSLPFPPHGATEDAAIPVTNGTQVVEDAVPTADGKWIYYDSDVSGTSEIYRQRLPHGPPEQLTVGGTNDFSPAPSPDGSRVAFHSWRSGSRDIYVLPLDGGPLQPVTASPLQEVKPQWSPDGKAITYTLFGGAGIYIARQGANGVWGKSVERTRPVPRASTASSWPTWSPDGRWIAYSNSFLGGSLFMINPDSGAPRTVLDSATSGIHAEYPVWSEDSRTLYFKSHDAKGNVEFWSIPITGGTPTLLARLDNPNRPSYRPEWSIGAGRMYFTIADLQSDVWVLQVARVTSR
jgi:eukaryotic-like serine/threonine-protein kinase